MRNQNLQNHLSTGARVRLLLATVMGLVLVVSVVLNSQYAAAQSVIQEPFGLSRDQIVSQLGNNYKEVPVAGGITSNGNIVEVFASPDGLSWTIVVTRPDGMSNVVAVGEAWSFISKRKGMPI